MIGLFGPFQVALINTIIGLFVCGYFLLRLVDEDRLFEFSLIYLFLSLPTYSAFVFSYVKHKWDISVALGKESEDTDVESGILLDQKVSKLDSESFLQTIILFANVGPTVFLLGGICLFFRIFSYWVGVFSLATSLFLILLWLAYIMRDSTYFCEKLAIGRV